MRRSMQIKAPVTNKILFLDGGVLMCVTFTISMLNAIPLRSIQNNIVPIIMSYIRFTTLLFTSLIIILVIMVNLMYDNIVPIIMSYIRFAMITRMMIKLVKRRVVSRLIGNTGDAIRFHNGTVILFLDTSLLCVAR